jgi:hypothetical protein
VQRIPVRAEFFGSFALISSLIPEHFDDESLLKFPYRFRAAHTSSIHLQDNTSDCSFTGDFCLQN